MEIISNTREFQRQKPTAVVLGKFDGIHLGHSRLLQRIMQEKERGLETVVFTFDRSPASLFIRDGSTYRELCGREEKRAVFERIGVDTVLEFPMNEETMSIPAEEFITEILQKRLCCKFLAAGEDISFGYRGLGDSKMLEAYRERCGFQVCIIDKVLTTEVFPEGSKQEISATLIRREIQLGNMEAANGYLGRSFSVTGTVIDGNHLGGPVLGVPTANIRWPLNKVLPAFGVYFTESVIEGNTYHGITNVGLKPTVSEEGTEEVLAETHLFDFQGDLYGKTMEVKLLHYVREEQRFEGLEALKNQLKQDLAYGKLFWSTRYEPTNISNTKK